MSSEAVNRRFIYVSRPFLIASICMHVAVPVGFLLVALLDHWGIHLFSGRKTPLRSELYQNYIQVDVVALPDELMNNRTSLDPTLPIVEKPAAVLEPKPVTEENKIDDTMKMIEERKAEDEKKAKEAKAKKAEEKAEAARKKAEEKAKKEAKAKAAEEKALKKLKADAEREAALKSLSEKGKQKGRSKVAGNMLSKGTSMSGMIGTAKDRYTALVSAKIREHFNIFAWQRKKGLDAVVYIEIYPTGRLKEKKLMKVSRDPVYDAAVLQAIEEAQPLPVPEDMAFIADGITLEFKPEN